MTLVGLLLFDSFANRSIVLALFNTWGFDMDDVKTVIPQAIDAMGTPPEGPAEAPKPEMGFPPDAPADAPKPEMGSPPEQCVDTLTQESLGCHIDWITCRSHKTTTIRGTE